MHVDLIESLRCPHRHADGWLVASADCVVNRQIVRGTIGCPTCGTEWLVRDGVLDVSGLPDATMPPRVAVPVPPPTDEHSRAEALRTAALLDLRDARGVVVLVGEAAWSADALQALTGVLVLAVNAPEGAAAAHSRLVVLNALPLGVGTVRGVRLDAAHGGDGWLGSAWRALEPAGRLMAPITASLPPGIVELARDDREWVAEVQSAASGLIPLRRR